MYQLAGKKHHATLGNKLVVPTRCLPNMSIHIRLLMGTSAGPIIHWKKQKQTSCKRSLQSMDFCDSSNPEMNEYLLWTNNARLWVLKSEFAYLGMLSHEASNFYQTRNHKSYREANNATQRDVMRHRFEPMVHGKKNKS